MKKLRLIIFTLLAFTLFNPNANAGWDEIGSGDGLEQSSSSQCVSSPGCFCKWNNANYGALQFSIIYYDGNMRYTFGTPVAYYNSPVGKYSWAEDRIKGAIYKSWLPWSSANNSNSNAIEAALIGQNQVANDYPIIREIFNDIGVDYEALLAAVSSNGSYTDKGVVFNNMVNEKIKGPHAEATKGIRVVVEPIVTIESTGKCSTYNKIIDKAFTVKNLFKWAYGQSDSGMKVVPDHTLKDFSTLLYLEYGDAGYRQASATNPILSQVSSPYSGWGLNIYGPFDKVQTDICDPDQEYEGYTSGVQYCCKKYNITPSDKSNNKTKDEGGKLKRKLTDYEINSECNKQKCDPIIDGVDKCCVECDVTPGNLENNHESDCLTTPIDPSALENSSCNKGKGENCEYALDVKHPGTCDSSNASYVKDIASWDCVFSSSNNRDVKDHYFDGASNDYCAVYCKEEVDMLLPTSGAEAKQGRFLVLGEVTANVPSMVDQLGPVTYKGQKTCRVTASKGSSIGSINTTRFLNDMKNVEDDIRTYWDAWKILEAQQKACNSGSGRYNNVDYACNIASDGSKPNYSTKIADAKRKYEEAVELREKHISQINACSQYATDGEFNFDPVVEFEYAEPVYGVNPNDTSKKWTLDKTEKVEKEQVRYTKTNWSTSSAVSYIQNSMYKCSGDVPCTKTDTYKYPNTKTWESTNVIEIKYGLPENLYRYISKSTARSFSSKTEAGGDNAIDMGIPNLPIHVSTLPGYYDFKINTKSLGAGNKFNQYVIENKPFNKIDYSQIEDYSCKFKVDCEDPLIVPDLDDYCEECEDSDLCTPPCDPGDPDCDKGGGGDDGDDDDDCPPSDPDCDKGGGGGDGDDDGDGPDCDPSTDPNCDKGGPLGVDLIYRPISLYSKTLAFPGSEGNGRTPGKNWGDSQIENFIVNNRGVEGYEIYKQSPLYEITLTPGLMKEIRNYNKELNNKLITIYDGAVAKTGIAGYGDYESMKCLGNGTMCVSNKIRDWGVDGCAIEGYDSSKFRVCDATLDKQWGLN